MTAGCNEQPSVSIQSPIVYVFHATWCQWCPSDAEIDRLAAGFPLVKFVSIDIDKDSRSWNVAREMFHQKGIPFFVVLESDGYTPLYHTTSFDDLKTWLLRY